MRDEPRHDGTTEAQNVRPGEQLRQARQLQKLPRQDIADRLHLDLNIIAAIEADDYQKLPSPTYVRGYLRSYARILSVPADAIIAAYDHFAPEPPALRPDASHPEQARSSDTSVKAVTYFISLALAILLLAWWQSHYVRTSPLEPVQVPAEEKIPNGEKASSMTTPEGTLSYPIEVVIHPDTISPVNSAVDNDDPQTVVASEVALSNDRDARPADGTITKSDTFHSELKPTETDEALPESQNSKGIEPTKGPDTLLMRVLQDSWIEVSDGIGTSLYYQLARRGDTIFLQGTSPFNVLLGYAPGVTVEYNGESFVTTPFTRASVAHFTLGERAADE
ncbi:MAG: DUF4115 domain-containing protein [Gammaproteobacteria bacterium]|nr:DUF4115 domain-containing protein [Gammaproteobacteria bacterium]MCI0591103.1 DUF4115 domain-containing protein [Gammaproteobacteria bacterium]